ncbi:anaphase-promoting complex subunit 1 isoform X3 [Agrilus planipennis]|nr:anaphase-promoting complex subunit 1 isoform X3 [Agrilus planipennis]XP_018321371.1 anaphase-promoting complex subunit 1 isoform X3 [Agrilus planipennis]
MSPLVTEGPLLNKLFRHNITRNAELYSSFPFDTRNTEITETTYQLDPSFCLELLWTDNVLSQQSNVGPASKVFLISDLAGRQFLCYLISTLSQLIIIEMVASKSNYFNFNYVTSIPAKDADVIPHLHMVAVLDHNSNINLYSGTTLVGKLHIGGVLVQHSPSPYAMRSIPQFNSPFPRRSTLLPHYSTPVADPNFEEHLLSPVLPLTPSEKRVGVMLTPEAYTTARANNRAQLVELRDAVDNRLTLRYSDGTCYRITFPDITCSSLINTCLNAMRCTLERDIVVVLISKWYAIRNAPGSSNYTQEKEWIIFTGLIFELLGYSEEDHEIQTYPYSTPSSAPKKQRTCSKGSDHDWNQLLNSDWHKNVNNNLSRTLNLKKTISSLESPNKSNRIHSNINATLFPHIYTIFFTLHLVYEDLKLSSLRYNELPLLANFLNRLSSDIGLHQYEVQYWKEFPDNCEIRGVNNDKCISKNSLSFVENKNLMGNKVESVFKFVFDLLDGKDVEPFPYIENVNVKTKNILQLCGLLISGSCCQVGTIELDKFVKQISLHSEIQSESFVKKTNSIKVEHDVAKKVVSLMTEMGITNKEMDTLPSGINLLLHDALWQCRENPPPDWSAKAYNLLQRPDLAAQAQIIERGKSESSIDKYGACGSLQEILPTIKQVDDIENEDGMEDIDNTLLKMRFPEDHRVAEARKLLQSSKPVTIALIQRPDVSDHDFIDEQEKHLYAICSRTMALPVGRGMFTMRTATPIITEPLPCPRLCLTGKTPPRGATVELTHIDTPPNMNLWPLFHNGVANGLRISPDAHNIDSNWIVFNKPKNSMETMMEHAGFLMALGLNGHLKNLAIMKTFDYLAKFHEMTSVGVLLGLAAANRGTANTSITKMLSIHIEALLPPTSMELDIPQNLQVAALMGIGLVYQGTGHRHMTEVLLSEIGRPPGPEMDNSIDRESYALAAGLALGLVTLRQAGKTTELTDLNVPDTLHYYMVGGNKRPLTGSQKDKYKVTSFQIKEGSTVNLDVTAPAATLALGLMFLGSGNKAVADWMAPPATQYLLDFVRPDFLMLRALARSLILWDEIEPSQTWVESQVPSTIIQYCIARRSSIENGIDYEAMNQAYCNIVAGACFAIGLKYAGSADEEAYKTLLYFCFLFTNLTSKTIADLAGKPTIETCLNVVLISIAIVMAGTGHLAILRFVRHLRRRVGVSSSSVVTYGSHLAVHMALGLLFLGGGRYTLSNSPSSIAALICAFYPKFPTHSNDNRYHLQAFRHLYVLAVESRIVIPKDISTGKMCYAWLTVIFLNGKREVMKGPCLIPDLNSLLRVSIDDDRHWPVVFERGRNWDLLLKLISSSGFIDVKQRAGCLSYVEDKLGYQSELARTLTQSTVIPWDPPPKSIISFSSDSTVRHFTKHFLISKSSDKSEEEATFQQTLTRATYDFVIRDKLPALPILISLVKIVCDVDKTPNVLQLWQFRIVCRHILKQTCVSNLISGDSCLALMQKLMLKVNAWEPILFDNLRSYLFGKQVNCVEDIARKIALYVSFYDIPYNENLPCQNWLELMCNMDKLKIPPHTMDKLLTIMNS